MVQVMCISERKSFPEHIQVGKLYWLDSYSLYQDIDDDWYGHVYADKDKNSYIGNLLLNHFKVA